MNNQKSTWYEKQILNGLKVFHAAKGDTAEEIIASSRFLKTSYEKLLNEWLLFFLSKNQHSTKAKIYYQKLTYKLLRKVGNHYIVTKWKYILALAIFHGVIYCSHDVIKWNPDYSVIIGILIFLAWLPIVILLVYQILRCMLLEARCLSGRWLSPYTYHVSSNPSQNRYNPTTGLPMTGSADVDIGGTTFGGDSN